MHNNFSYKNKVYDLKHLYNFEMAIMQTSKDNKPDRTYNFFVSFSIHCFTTKTTKNINETLIYPDNKERRFFCFERYELSKKLPEIIRHIGEKKCFHTNHNNYMLIEINDVQYEIFFNVKKSNKKGYLNMYIESAYVRDESHSNIMQKRKPIKFFVIAFNILNNKPIKKPA